VVAWLAASPALRVTGPGCAIVVGHPHGGDDVAHGTLDLDRAIVDRVADAGALANCQGDGRLDKAADGDPDIRGCAAEIGKAKLGVHINVVVPGEPVGSGSLVGGSPIISEKSVQAVPLYKPPAGSQEGSVLVLLILTGPCSQCSLPAYLHQQAGYSCRRNPTDSDVDIGRMQQGGEVLVCPVTHNIV